MLKVGKLDVELPYSANFGGVNFWWKMHLDSTILAVEHLDKCMIIQWTSKQRVEFWQLLTNMPDPSKYPPSKILSYTVCTFL